MKFALVAVSDEPLICTKCHVGNVAPLGTGASSQVLAMCMTVRGPQAARRTCMAVRVFTVKPNALSSKRGAEHSCLHVGDPKVVIGGLQLVPYSWHTI